MLPQENNLHTQFGIDEVYIHPGFPPTLLEKLQQRAALSFDSEDPVIQKNVSQEMILIFHRRLPSQSLIYRFLESLHQHSDKKNYIKSNTLINEEELFAAIKSKKFILVTYRILSKASYCPNLK